MLCYLMIEERRYFLSERCLQKTPFDEKNEGEIKMKKIRLFVIGLSVFALITSACTGGGGPGVPPTEVYSPPSAPPISLNWTAPGW